MKIRFVAAVVMAQVIAPTTAMEQQQHDSEQARTKAVLEIFKRMVLVVDNATVIPVFKNLQLTTKMGTNKDFVLPYLKNA